MERIITSERAAHWYLPDGTPFYEVPYADKKRAGEMRPATIADARKAGAVPSVTTILRILAKPGLESWKQEQAILAALTLPHKDGESLEDFAHRVAEDAAQEGAKAAEDGTKIHQAVVEHMDGRDQPDAMKPYIAGFLEWHNAFCKSTSFPRCEVSFACADYGGRIDLLYPSAKVDIKTVTSKPGKPLPRYDEWPLQLVAYDDGHKDPCWYPGRLINLVLSRNEPGRWEAIEYTQNYGIHLAAWRNVLSLWQYLNNWQKED